MFILLNMKNIKDYNLIKYIYSLIKESGNMHNIGVMQHEDGKMILIFNIRNSPKLE